MTFLNRVKAANATAAFVIISATVAAIWHLPSPDAWRMLTALVVAAGGWLLVERVKDKTP